MEKAEWQRDHHRQMRSIYKERVKEKDKRYLFSKYAGILSASVAFVGASSLGWNYKNYLKQTRDYQLSFAVDTLQRRAPPSATTKQGDAVVLRPKEERWIKKIIDRMDIHHPRVVVLTGYQGCGKSTLVRRVVSQESIPVVYVDVHSKEDTLRSVIKALGVPNVDACGEPSEFIADACTEARNRLGKTPLLVLKMREEDSLARVYNEAVTLACDRRVCHLILEVPLESLTIANTSLPRLDFYTVPAFSRKQAYAYTKHRFDALLLEQFMDIVGTNSNDLDELFAFMRQRSASPVEYINQKLLKSMRQLQSAWSQNPRAKEAVKRLSDFSYRDGQREGVDENSLRDPALQDIIIYNPVQDCWLFANKTLHTAARCCL
ncbi:tuzin [Angomonas deanei]|nr:tuzin [Angomonas deanei]|eukprot:EPY28852.1 tuzin [Angomonas deanei]